ncbi:MAG: hypothetical protein P8P30_05930 [Rickettsiales bacterium]|nr:hypothetical protein [Rickettsiales bacterium]
MSARRFRFRLLPITLIACALFILLKVDEMAMDQKYLARGIIPPAYAAKADKKDDKKEVAKAKKAESEDDTEKTEGEEEAPKNENVSLTPPEKVVDVDKRFNQIELDLLQSLSQRREEIDQYEQEVGLRENLLEATEMRIDNKIKQMDVMRVELQELLERNKVQEDTELKSLVKIYESMKPKEAARIFEELKMSILLEVIDRMSERKAAPILANMTPKRATEVTVKLAELRQLRQQATKDLAEGALAEGN